MIRIGIVDDHKVVRAGLRAYLCSEPDIEVVGEACDGREAVELVRSQAIDVLLMDLSMPGQSGLDVMTMIRAKAPETSILILTGHSEAQYAVKLIRSGAAGFLSKDGDPSEIPRAVRTVAQGRRFITPAVAELMAGTLLHQTEKKAAHERLSEREFQIFLKIARGAKSIEISDQLFISPKTVATNRVTIMAKLGMSTVSEVTYYALKHGLID
jgi:two-component system invasion response regulator UvrY